MNAISAWLRHLATFLVGITVVVGLALLAGYSPFTSTLGGGWEGWFVEDRLGRLPRLVDPIRTLFLPFLIATLPLGIMAATSARFRADFLLRFTVLALTGLGGVAIASALGPVAPDLYVAALVVAWITALWTGGPKS